MMTCREVADRASALIDGELSIWDALQMRLHLAMCKGCNRFIGQMRTTRILTEVPANADEMTAADDLRISAILTELRNGKQTGD